MNDSYLSNRDWIHIVSDAESYAYGIGFFVGLFFAALFIRKYIKPRIDNEEWCEKWPFRRRAIITFAIFIYSWLGFACPIIGFVKRNTTDEITIYNAHKCATSARLYWTHDEDFTIHGAMIYNESDSVLIIWYANDNSIIDRIEPKQHVYAKQEPSEYIGTPYEDPCIFNMVYIGYEATYDSIVVNHKLWGSKLLREILPPEKVFNSK